jgi:hypothetical protein
MLKIKEMATYFDVRTKIKDKDSKQYFIEYEKQINIIIKAFNDLIESGFFSDIGKESDSLRQQALRSLESAAIRIDAEVDKARKNVNLKVIEFLKFKKRKRFASIIKTLRKDLKSGKKNQKNGIVKAVNEASNNMYFDVALGYLREKAIEETEEKFLEDVFDVILPKDKDLKTKNIATIDTKTMRADTYSTTVELEDVKYHLGFNVKSYSGKGFKGEYVSSKYRDFQTYLKKENSLLYNY